MSLVFPLWSWVILFLSFLLEVCQFYWSFQRTSSFSLTFSIAFILLISFILLLSLLFPSFLLLWYYFALVFLDSLGGIILLHSLFEMVYFFPMYEFSAINFPLRLASALPHKIYFHVVQCSFSLLFLRLPFWPLCYL